MTARFALRCVLLAALAGSLAGCLGKPYAARGTTGDVTGSIAQGQAALDGYAARYRANPNDVQNAMNYGRALRANGQAQQAVAVLQRMTLRNNNDMVVLGEYGRALADAGQNDQALDVLSRAHRPDQPDWRVYNVIGTIYDAKAQHAEAQATYEKALKLAPGEPAILSNLGLSYALARNLPQGERILRQAAQDPRSGTRVKQNLALVVGLQGRFAEAEQIARAELPPDQAQANVAYLRGILAQPNHWQRLKGQQQAANPAAKTQIASETALAPMRPASLPAQ